MFDFSSLNNAFAGADKWLGDQKNMTNFTTVMDAIGGAGGSPFAGVGTMMNQSKLANQARLDQNAQTQAMLRAFGLPTGESAAAPTGATSSTGAPALSPTPVQQTNEKPSSITDSLADIPLTPVEEDGVSSYTVKPVKDGGREISMKISDMGKKKSSGISMADMTSRPF